MYAPVHVPRMCRAQAYKTWTFTKPGLSLLRHFRESERDRVTSGGPRKSQVTDDLSLREIDRPKLID